MKIMLLIRSLAYGGAQRQVIALARGLHQRGHKVIVVTFYPGGELEQDLQDTGVCLRSLNKQGRWDIVPGFLSRLIALVRAEQPDIVHGYLGGPNALTSIIKPFCPNVHMVWGVRVSYMDLSSYDWMVRLHYPVEALLSHLADLIIANSYKGMEYAATRGFPRRKMLVIPNGIDTEHFHSDPQAGQQMRREWGVQDDEQVIGLVGRLDPAKDHPTFLHAAQLLARERDNVRFVCIGGRGFGPPRYQEELHQLSNDLGLAERVIWAGASNNMVAAYNALDIVASASHSEGFPNVIGEAMACDIMCVATDVGHTAWIVGNAGVVVPPRNARALAAGWQIALTSAERWKTSPRERIINQFSLSHLIDRTEQTLLELLG
jgi:glycosyltransferase involved in cell wall biosynthesis